MFFVFFVCVEQESLENVCVFSLEHDNKQSQRLRS